LFSFQFHVQIVLWDLTLLILKSCPSHLFLLIKLQILIFYVVM
jgi:hypothetical protein